MSDRTVRLELCGTGSKFDYACGPASDSDGTALVVYTNGSRGSSTAVLDLTADQAIELASMLLNQVRQRSR